MIRAGDTGWALQEVFTDRGKALNAAKYALLQKSFSGAKVVKETCNLATGASGPITVFAEHGPNVVKHTRRVQAGAVRPACVTPRGRFCPESRAVISSALDVTRSRAGR